MKTEPDYSDICDVAVLLGKTCTTVEREGDEQIRFRCDDGTSYLMWHRSHCCESVTIDDIDGDLDLLVGSPFVQAECVDNPPDAGARDEYDESHTWTFYKFATAKGHLTIKWYGVSNGYYSESVDFGLIR